MDEGEGGIRYTAQTQRARSLGTLRRARGFYPPCRGHGPHGQGRGSFKAFHFQLKAGSHGGSCAPQLLVFSVRVIGGAVFLAPNEKEQRRETAIRNNTHI